MNTETQTAFLRLPDVMARTTLKKSTIYKHIKAKKFPAPAKLEGAARWPEHEIETWINSKLAARGVTA